MYLRLLDGYDLVLGIQTYREHVCKLVDSEPFVDHRDVYVSVSRNGVDRECRRADLRANGNSPLYDPLQVVADFVLQEAVCGEQRRHLHVCSQSRRHVRNAIRRRGESAAKWDESRRSGKLHREVGGSQQSHAMSIFRALTHGDSIPCEIDGTLKCFSIVIDQLYLRCVRLIARVREWNVQAASELAIQ